ncbi:peptidoglycan-binding domain-containing protein [Pseudoxanthomonas sp.]|uniref:peptidoglycan-binding domain-containing protein n=1 Tax=Pseudoxanthomonas sp. TaxID=1871049 RepID=UPI002639FC97|nr:peptidoglycan-binding domain-containing protein [Pseudoxanthomonas sp.]WDS36637.1 MAG: peptidoglycan-binding domain-containing protein [Pseudoxanthomonas sp.]
MSGKDWELGQTSKHYETGGRGASTVSSGIDDPGGVSYGSYQMTSQVKTKEGKIIVGGTVASFVKDSKHADDFAGLKPGSAEFSAKWKDLARTDGSFAQEQHDYIKRTHYDKLVDRLQGKGLDLSDRGPAVQDALWSTAVQYGPGSDKKPGGSGVFLKGLEAKFGKDYDLSKLSDKDIVGAVQDYKADHVKGLFPRVEKQKTLDSLENRARNEKADLFKLADLDNTVTRTGEQHGNRDPARQPGKSHAAHSPSAENGDGVLTRNEHGVAVKDLQEKLSRLGYMDAKDAIGTYGPKTEAAVEKFQQHNGLKGVDGKAGPETLASIDKQLQKQQGVDQLRREDPMFDQAIKHLEKQGPNGGYANREEMQRAAGQVVFEARVSGMSRIDDLVRSTDGRGMLAVERNPNNPLDVNRVYVDRQQAATVPLEQSQQQTADILRQTQSQDQLRTHEQSTQAPMR